MYSISYSCDNCGCLTNKSFKKGTPAPATVTCENCGCVASKGFGPVAPKVTPPISPPYYPPTPEVPPWKLPYKKLPYEKPWFDDNRIWYGDSPELIVRMEGPNGTLGSFSPH